jgi:hypothetical protein
LDGNVPCGTLPGGCKGSIVDRHTKGWRSIE